jgi:phytoene synthase
MSAAVQPAPTQFSPTESQLAVAYSVCRSITRSAAKNFYYAFLVLPRSKRHALCAVYAFMRRCDDLSDDISQSIDERRQKLNAWMESFHRVLGGHSTDDPVLLALSDAQRRFDIPPQLLDQLAYGTAMDLDQESSADDESSPLIRYKTFDDLHSYCYHVASVVGLVCIRIFGYRDPAAEPLAERCGLAFQLTNIIRDVKEDAEMGRIYFPVEDLDKFGLSVEDFHAPWQISRLQPLLADYSGRARELYRSGDELIALVSEDSQPALWALIAVYRALLDKIALRHYNVLGGKVKLSRREKLAILARAFLRRLA